jgi:hypothetical protein
VSTLQPGDPHGMGELADALLAMTRDGQALLAELPLPAFFAPQGDRWSPAEHARHLTVSSKPLLLAYALPALALRVAFGSATRASRPYARLREDYRAVLAAGGQAGKFAPSPERPPGDPAGRRREILDAWADTNARLAARVRSWPEGAAETARIKHPLLGPLTVREMAAFTVYHTVHHLTLVRDRLRNPPGASTAS